MNVPFTQVGTGNSAVQGIGMIDGWEFDNAGTLFAVSWYGANYSATAVYSINTSTWTATSLYDLAPQLPSNIISLDGLSDVVVPVATRKNACKNGGWQLLARADDTPFKNQGDCIQYVNTGK